MKEEAVGETTTEKNGETQTWHSGDWTPAPRKNVPYNGIEISGTPTYDATTGRFLSADVEIVDCTYDKEGVGSSLDALTVDEGWVGIPPAMQPVSPPVADPKFTASGNLQLRRGSSAILVGVDFSYGLEGQHHEELGFVFGFPTTVAEEPEATGAGPARNRRR